jgi:HAD superfamily hydrolase (TIGR01549 family)
MYKAVIFDMDDTLIKTRVAKYRAHKHAAKYFYDLAITDEDLNQHWGKPFEVMVGDLYKNVEPTEQIIEKYYSISGQFPISAYPGAREIVSTLGERLPIGLLTAANQKLMLAALRDAKIDVGVFQYVQTSEYTDFHKPDPRVFEPAIQYLGIKQIKKEEIMYVGDSLDDYVAATKAGLGFVGIHDHTNKKEIFDRAGVDSIGEFGELLEKLF